MVYTISPTLHFNIPATLTCPGERVDVHNCFDVVEFLMNKSLTDVLYATDAEKKYIPAMGATNCDVEPVVKLFELSC